MFSCQRQDHANKLLMESSKNFFYLYKLNFYREDEAPLIKSPRSMGNKMSRINIAKDYTPTQG